MESTPLQRQNTKSAKQNEVLTGTSRDVSPLDMTKNSQDARNSANSTPNPNTISIKDIDLNIVK